MGVLAFNHFNIRAPKPLLEEVRTFYVDVVGLAEGFRPAVPVPGYWLYLEALPILHLMEWGDVLGTPARERVTSTMSLSRVTIWKASLPSLKPRRGLYAKGFRFDRWSVYSVRTDRSRRYGVELNFG